MENLLEVTDLQTTFTTLRGKVTAVDGVSFQVGKGEILGIVGESGCGKSVTSQSIMRLYDEKEMVSYMGKVWFEGKNLLDLSEQEMRSIRGNQISMFACTGSEAVDLALRIAFSNTQADGVVISEFAYHGTTMAVSSVSPSLGNAVPLGQHESGIQVLKDAGLEVVISPSTDTKTLISLVQDDVIGIIVRASVLNGEVLAAGKNLKIVGRHGAGYDNIDVKTANQLHEHCSYKNYVEDSNTYRLLKFMYDPEKLEQKMAYKMLMKVVLLFKSEEERKAFES